MYIVESASPVAHIQDIVHLTTEGTVKSEVS